LEELVGIKVKKVDGILAVGKNDSMVTSPN